MPNKSKTSKVSVKSKLARKNAWFIPMRGSYLPASWQGWLTYIPFTAYLLFAVYAGCQNTNSKSLAILYVVPNWVAAVVVMTWVAKRTS